MTTEEMKRQLIEKGYIVKKAGEASGVGISRRIVREIEDYVHEKYGWKIYYDRIHKGERHKNLYSDVISEMMKYIKQKMLNTWNIKSYLHIQKQDIPTVISWGKEWIDNYISSHKDEWEKEEKEKEEKRRSEMLKTDPFVQMTLRIVKEWNKKRKLKKAYDYASK